MALTVIKQVRLRGRDVGKEVGWLDIKLSLELKDKEYYVICKYASGPNADKVYGDLYKEARLKFLESLLDKYPINTENLLKLVDFVKEKY